MSPITPMGLLAEVAVAAKPLIKETRESANQEPKTFYIYKATPPHGNLAASLVDGELPWVYDQDPSSGFVARMLVTPYAQPSQPSREWVGLTDEDRQSAFESMPDMLDGFLKKWGWLHFSRAIEAKLKEKNA